VNAHRFESLDQMAREENDIFGSTVDPGRCQVRVRTTRLGKPDKLARWLHKYAYALWPLSAARQDVTVGVEFDLTLSFWPGMEKALVPAVEAFLLYGGVGGRTRRGCGSLQATRLTVTQPGKQPLTYDYTASGPGSRSESARLPLSLGQPKTALTTGLPECLYTYGEPVPNARDAWAVALGAFQRFRQGEGVGRESRQGSRPGRTRYPEADTIRTMTRTLVSSSPRAGLVTGFPRADLGLPMILHFSRGGPADTTIQVASQSGKRHRFTSPVITKAIQRSGGFQPMIAVLNAPHVWEQAVQLLSPQIPAAQSLVSTDDIALSAADRSAVGPLGGRQIREALGHYLLDPDYHETPWVCTRRPR